MPKRKTTKRIGRIAPKTKELLQLVERQKALTQDLLAVALQLDVRAKAADVAGLVLTIEQSDD